MRRITTILPTVLSTSKTKESPQLTDKKYVKSRGNKQRKPTEPRPCASNKATWGDEIRLLAWEVAFYTVFLSLLVTTAFDNRDQRAFAFTEATLGPMNPKDAIDEITTPTDMWKWIGKHFVPNMFREKHWNNSNLQECRGKCIHSLVSIRVGPIRLRQHRMRPEPCEPLPKLQSMNVHCVPGWSSSDHDWTDYAPKWKTLTEDVAASGSCPVKAFTYKTWSLIGGTPVMGRIGYYPAGGYVIDLSGHIISVQGELQELQENNWVDQWTKVVMVETAIYNPSSNLFAQITAMFEFPQANVIKTKLYMHPFKLFTHVGDSDWSAWCFDLLLVVCLAWFGARIYAKMRALKLSFLKKFWNVLELLNFLLAIAAWALYMGRQMVAKTVSQDASAMEQDQYYNYQTLAMWDQVGGILLGFTCCISTLQVLHLCRFNRRLSLLGATMSRAASDLMGFSVMFALVMCCFVSFSFIIFGSSLYMYSTVVGTIQSLLLVALGDLQYDDLQAANRIFAPLFVIIYVGFMVFLLLNVLVSILVDSFTIARDAIQNQTNDFELIDYMVGRAKDATQALVPCIKFSELSRKWGLFPPLKSVPPGGDTVPLVDEQLGNLSGRQKTRMVKSVLYGLLTETAIKNLSIRMNRLDSRLDHLWNVFAGEDEGPPPDISYIRKQQEADNTISKRHAVPKTHLDSTSKNDVTYDKTGDIRGINRLKQELDESQKSVSLGLRSFGKDFQPYKESTRLFEKINSSRSVFNSPTTPLKPTRNALLRRNDLEVCDVVIEPPSPEDHTVPGGKDPSLRFNFGVDLSVVYKDSSGDTSFGYTTSDFDMPLSTPKDNLSRYNKAWLSPHRSTPVPNEIAGREKLPSRISFTSSARGRSHTNLHDPSAPSLTQQKRFDLTENGEDYSYMDSLFSDDLGLEEHRLQRAAFPFSSYTSPEQVVPDTRNSEDVQSPYNQNKIGNTNKTSLYSRLNEISPRYPRAVYLDELKVVTSRRLSSLKGLDTPQDNDMNTASIHTTSGSTHFGARKSSLKSKDSFNRTRHEKSVRFLDTQLGSANKERSNSLPLYKQQQSSAMKGVGKSFNQNRSAPLVEITGQVSTRENKLRNGEPNPPTPQTALDLEKTSAPSLGMILNPNSLRNALPTIPLCTEAKQKRPSLSEGHLPSVSALVSFHESEAERLSASNISTSLFELRELEKSQFDMHKPRTFLSADNVSHRFEKNMSPLRIIPTIVITPDTPNQSNDTSLGHPSSAAIGSKNPKLFCGLNSKKISFAKQNNAQRQNRQAPTLKTFGDKSLTNKESNKSAQPIMTGGTPRQTETSFSVLSSPQTTPRSRERGPIGFSTRHRSLSPQANTPRGTVTPAPINRSHNNSFQSISPQPLSVALSKTSNRGLRPVGFAASNTSFRSLSPRPTRVNSSYTNVPTHSPRLTRSSVSDTSITNLSPRFLRRASTSKGVGHLYARSLRPAYSNTSIRNPSVRSLRSPISNTTSIGNMGARPLRSALSNTSVDNMSPRPMRTALSNSSSRSLGSRSFGSNSSFDVSSESLVGLDVHRTFRLGSRRVGAIAAAPALSHSRFSRSYTK